MLRAPAKALLDGPAGGVAGDQGGGAGGQVGGDQGEQAVVAVAGEDDLHGAGVQAAVPQAGDGGQVHVLVAAVDPDGGGGPAGGGGELAGGAQVGLDAGRELRRDDDGVEQEQDQSPAQPRPTRPRRVTKAVGYSAHTTDLREAGWADGV